MARLLDIDGMLSEIKQQPHALRDTIEKNRSIIKQIGLNLSNKVKNGEIDNVVIIARGSSDNAAALGKYIIETTLGIPVSLAAPSVINLYKASLNLTKSLVIGVSQSGKTNEVVDFMTQVKEVSGFSISITNDRNSSLAHLGLSADLFCNVGVEKAVAATKSFSATLIIFYLIAAAMSGDLDENIDKLMMIPELIEQTIDTAEEEICNISCWLGSYDECIILARGFNYPIALEASLKLQECSYIRAKAYSGADFQHGPMAITRKGLPFIFFMADGPSYEGSKWLCQSLLEKGGDILVFSPNMELDLKNKGAKVITIPQSPEYLSPYIFCVSAQLLTFYSAIAKGINPNEPHWLNKITNTI